MPRSLDEKRQENAGIEYVVHQDILPKQVLTD